jgi:hypothetical protein
MFSDSIHNKNKEEGICGNSTGFGFGRGFEHSHLFSGQSMMVNPDVRLILVPRDLNVECWIAIDSFDLHSHQES